MKGNAPEIYNSFRMSEFDWDLRRRLIEENLGCNCFPFPFEICDECEEIIQLKGAKSIYEIKEEERTEKMI